MTSRIPLIGLTPDYSPSTRRLMINEDYMESVREAGGLPVLLPLAADEQTLLDCLSRLSGIVFTGGADIEPALYGQERHPWCGEAIAQRDAMELPLMRMVLADPSMPFLAICRGVQVMNCAAGGDLCQDIAAERPGCLTHPRHDRPAEEVHRITLTPGTRLAQLFGTPDAGVNSRHHQAIGRVGEGMVVSATAEDGIIEALEVTDRACGIGVQWHPESMHAHSAQSRALFSYLIEAAQVKKKQR